MARRRMSPEQAQRLAEKYQERYPDASPREIAEIVNDPTQHFYEPILGGMYRGLKIPENMTTPQADAWKAAVDQRMAGFDDRQTALQADARRRLNEEIRSNIAGVVKPASMAASLTPYDLGLGDVGYAAGELIDPEGTYGDAMLAAGGGLLTAGLGSGAILSKAAKESRDLLRARMLKDRDVEDLALLDDTLYVTVDPSASQLKRLNELKNKVYKKYNLPEDVPPRRALRDLNIRQRNFPDLAPTVIKQNPGAVSKAPMRRQGQVAVMEGPPPTRGVSDLGDLTPTVIKQNPNIPMKRTGTPPSSARRSLEEVSKMSKAEQDALLPALRKGNEYQAYANRYGSGGRFPDFSPTPPQIDPSLITKQSTRSVIPPELAIGVGGAAAIGALGKENLRGQEDVSAGARGMGYQDMVDEMAAKPIDPNLSVRMMNEVRKTTDYGNAFAETTDRQSPMNFSSADALSDLPSFYQENRDAAARIFEQTGTVPPGMARSLGKYEALMNTRGALLDEESRMLREGIAFKPSTPIVEDRTAMAGQGGMDREIEPAMGDYGE